MMLKSLDLLDLQTYIKKKFGLDTFWYGQN